MFKSNKAITLIALIITIIILLILAAVTINMVIGDNGLFNKAKAGVEKYQNAQEKEKLLFGKVENEMDKYISGNFREETVTLSKTDYDGIINRLTTMENKVQALEEKSALIVLNAYTNETSSNPQSINLAYDFSNYDFITISATDSYGTPMNSIYYTNQMAIGAALHVFHNSEYVNYTFETNTKLNFNDINDGNRTPLIKKMQLIKIN